MVQYRQNKYLMSFLKGLKVRDNGEIRYNPLDDELPVLSQYFTPQFKVSQLAVTVKELIDDKESFEATSSIPEPPLVNRLRRSELKYSNRRVYSLIQATFLESFAILYAIDNNPQLVKRVNKEDMENIHNNINYVAEILGDNHDYADVIKALRQINADILYIMSRMEGEFNAL